MRQSQNVGAPCYDWEIDKICPQGSQPSNMVYSILQFCVAYITFYGKDLPVQCFNLISLHCGPFYLVTHHLTNKTMNPCFIQAVHVPLLQGRSRLTTVRGNEILMTHPLGDRSTEECNPFISRHVRNQNPRGQQKSHRVSGSQKNPLKGGIRNTRNHCDTLEYTDGRDKENTGGKFNDNYNCADLRLAIHALNFSPCVAVLVTPGSTKVN